MGDNCLSWDKLMTSKQAAKYHLTGGFIAVELFRKREDRIKELEAQLDAYKEQLECTEREIVNTTKATQAERERIIKVLRGLPIALITTTKLNVRDVEWIIAQIKGGEE